jgi:hypothetical protein
LATAGVESGAAARRTSDPRERSLVVLGLALGVVTFLLVALLLALMFSGSGRGRNRDGDRGGRAIATADEPPGEPTAAEPRSVETKSAGENGEPESPRPATSAPSARGDFEPDAGAGSMPKPQTRKAHHPGGEFEVTETKKPIESGSLPAEKPAKSTPGGFSHSGLGSIEFFGVQSRGSSVVYVVDRSASMAGSRFRLACQELVGSIEQLTANEKYLVIFFSDDAAAVFGDRGKPRLLPATPRNRRKSDAWIFQTRPGGGTNPLPALLAALGLEPDVIFFLTDGEFPPAVAEQVRRANRRPCIINTLAIGSQANVELLKRIALENQGEFRLVVD